MGGFRMIEISVIFSKYGGPGLNSQHTMPLAYDNAYWQKTLGPDIRKSDIEQHLHLIFSLIIFLQVSLAQLLEFIFMSEIEEIKLRVSRFMGYTTSATTEDKKFPPGMVFRAWLKFPKAQEFVRKMIKPVAHKIVEEESDKMIRDPELKVTMKTLTLKGIQELLQPQKIMDKYREHAPFTWDLLYTFVASPNKWRKEKAKKATAVDEGDEEDWEDDPNLPDDEPEKTWSVPQIPEGFSRNPVLVSCELSVYLIG